MMMHPDLTDAAGNPVEDLTDEISKVPGPFVSHIAMQFTLATRVKTVGVVDITQLHHQPYGIVHGGVYCAMAETVASIGGALAARHIGAPDSGAVGQSNHTDFLKATSEGQVTATATPIHIGRSVQLWNVDMTNNGVMVAQSKVRLFNVGVERLNRD